jgi:hypothetical protein
MAFSQLLLACRIINRVFTTETNEINLLKIRVNAKEGGTC